MQLVYRQLAESQSYCQEFETENLQGCPGKQPEKGSQSTKIALALLLQHSACSAEKVAIARYLWKT
jgi:hypothetical protein